MSIKKEESDSDRRGDLVLSTNPHCAAEQATVHTEVQRVDEEEYVEEEDEEEERDSTSDIVKATPTFSREIPESLETSHEVERRRYLLPSLPGLLLVVLAYSFLNMPNTYLPVLLIDQFNIPESTSALILSANAIGYTVACLVSPKLDDMFRTNLLQLCAVFLFMVCGGSFSFILYLPKSWVVPYSAILIGLAGFSSGVFENIFTIVQYRRYPVNIGLVAASLEVAVSAGALVGPLVGGVLFTWSDNFMTTTLVPLVPILLVSAWFAYLVRSDRGQFDKKSEQTEEHGSFVKLLGSWQMCALYSFPLYCMVAMGTPIPITALYIRDAFGGTAMTSGFLFLAMILGYLMGVLTTGPLSDIPRYRWTCKWFFCLSPFFNAVGMFIVGPAFFIPLQPSLYWIGGGFFVGGAAFGIGTGPIFRMLLEMWRGLHPASKVDYTAYITSVYLVCFSVGEGAGNIIGGALYAHLTFNQIHTLLGASFILLGLCNVVFIALNKDVFSRTVESEEENISPPPPNLPLDSRGGQNWHYVKMKLETVCVENVDLVRLPIVL